MEDELLPPPRRPDATPLSNSDFRKFLDTPRRDAAAASLGQQQRQKGQSKAEGQAHKPKKSYKPRRKAEDDEAAAEEELYRDRAAERRKGLNIDYEGAALDPATGADTNYSVEDSKFLGGDVEHTHLVKGLDFALLQKIKAELVQPGAIAKEQPQLKPKAAEKKQGPKFVTSRGQAIFNAILQSPSHDASESFQPRRLAFVYELDADSSSPDVPTTLRRSAADCPQVVDTITASTDGPVLERLAKVLSYMRSAGAGQNGKRLKRKDKLRMLEALDEHSQRAQAEQPRKPDADKIDRPTNGHLLPPTAAAKAAAMVGDDDIFADAGNDYKLEARSQQAASRGDGSYFAQPDDMRDLPPVREGHGDDDMELDEPAAPPPPPGVPPPPPGPPVGPGLPPPGYNREAAYADMNRAAGQDYEAYMQANVAYQASRDPEYQALLAKQQALHAEAAGAHAHLPPPPPQEAALTQEEKEAGLASVFRRADSKQDARREADARERDPDHLSDAYAECYPGYHEYAAQIVDSDEEDLSHMDAKGQGQKRADFETEEQWQAYKSKKEAAPKAAFQFGVKVSDGRKAYKDLGVKAREQKLNNQLNQIQKRLEKDGGNYGTAFGTPAIHSGDAGSGASKKRRI